MSDSEAGTQASSPRRRREARERGQAAKSRMLTASASLLMGAAALSLWGDPLIKAFVDLMRSSWGGDLPLRANPAEAIEPIREAFSAILAPVAGVLITMFITAVFVHQMQVGGLIAPGLLAPDLSRLRRSSDGDSIWEQGLWSIAKTIVAVAAGGAVIWLRLPELLEMGRHRADFAESAGRAGQLLLEVLIWVASAALALGGLDYLIQRRKFERMLQSTPQQLREERNDEEGDPALRARRRELAKARREESELVALRGIGLVVTGESGLTIGLAPGDPQTGGAAIRFLAHGPEGHRLRYSARMGRIPMTAAADFASRLSAAGAYPRPLRSDERKELEQIASEHNRLGGVTATR